MDKDMGHIVRFLYSHWMSRQFTISNVFSGLIEAALNEIPGKR